ncbi:DUF697 domain-containing protein [Desulfococcaceae bacterium HSG8]|nr:DUF697 domain-containing protein [Desulfococcaceae bacterium HSG8]
MTTSEETLETTDPQTDADKIIRNHVIGSAGVGLIPVPLLDLAGLTGVQLNMLRRLAKVYGISFNKDRGKNLLAALIGGGAAIPIGNTVASLVKVVPIVGQAAGALSMPAVAGATTYAVGKVFLQHFASGGTFLTFDPEEVRTYYSEMLKEGEKVVGDVK